MMEDRVSLVEVGPRDGLQNEPGFIPTSTRLELIKRLVAAGIRAIEVGSFVSPKAVPQMAGTAEIVQALPPGDGLRYSVLVPNLKGMEAALATGVPNLEIAVFASASESFSRRNINCTIDESIERFRPVMELAAAHAMKVRGYVSCVLGCPYEGEVAPAAVVSVAYRLAELGCYEISLGDTIGIGTPRQAQLVARAVAAEIGIERVAGHFHDTRGQALANILACLEEGVRVFDSAVAGLGGCPYAPGATGNVATEDLVYMLDGLGVNTGIDLAAVADAGNFISGELGRRTSSRVAAAMAAARDARTQ